MMISYEISASSDSALRQSINWKALEANVLKLQMRIAKATRDGARQSKSIAVDTDSLSLSKTSCC